MIAGSERWWRAEAGALRATVAHVNAARDERRDPDAGRTHLVHAVDELLALAHRCGADAVRALLVGPGDPEDRLDAALGRPSCALVVYGTLAPGEENDWVLAPLGGTWHPARVHGTVDDHLGYPLLRPDPDGPVVQGVVFRSDALAAHWPAVDDFEGSEYDRHLVVYEDAAGCAVANVYVAASHLR